MSRFRVEGEEAPSPPWRPQEVSVRRGVRLAVVFRDRRGWGPRWAGCGVEPALGRLPGRKPEEESTGGKAVGWGAGGGCLGTPSCEGAEVQARREGT